MRKFMCKCDLCNNTFNENDVFEFELELKDHYGKGYGSGLKRFDICRDCINNKLGVFIKEGWIVDQGCRKPNNNSEVEESSALIIEKLFQQILKI